MRMLSRMIAAAALAVVLPACDDPDAVEVIDLEEEGEGVAFDQDNPGADIEGLGKAEYPRTYEIPTDLPQLERPEIIVSLATRTVHLFDRATGFSAVYPAGPGALGSSGRSITPRGFYKTSPDLEDAWYYVARRYEPDYFGGFPFLRLDIPNSSGAHTYAFHGPITYTCPGGGSGCGLLDRQWFLRHDYVSHGCVRMEAEDIVEMFWTVRQHPAVPVAIFDGVEIDAAGQPVDLGTDPALWAQGDAIQYAECGSRPDPYTVDNRWTSKGC